MEFNKTKTLYSLEQEKLEELQKLKVEYGLIKKVRTSIADYEELIKDIEVIINKMKDKKNKIELFSNINKDINTDNMHNVKAYSKQLDYLSEKNEEIDAYKSNSLNFVEKSKFRHQNINFENQDEDSIYKMEIIKGKTSGIYEKVRKEIDYMRNIKISNFWKSELDRKIIDKRQKNLKDIISIFENVITESKEIIANKYKKDEIKNFNHILEEIKNEFPTLKISRLAISANNKNIDDSLYQNIYQSNKNIENVSDKLSNMIWNRNNSFIESTLSMVNSTISLSKQNNKLMEQITKYSKNYYSALYERFITNENPENFNNLKREIANEKQINDTNYKNIINEDNPSYNLLDLDSSY